MMLLLVVLRSTIVLETCYQMLIIQINQETQLKTTFIFDSIYNREAWQLPTIYIQFKIRVDYDYKKTQLTK